MRKFVVLVTAVLLVAGSVFWVAASGAKPQTPPQPAALGEGSVAPDVTLRALSGETVTLSKLRGKVVVLNFWATWCPPCKAEMPSMDKLNTQLKGSNFVMLAVNADEDGREAVAAFVKQNPHSFQVLLDEGARAQQLYGVYRFPETFIIGKDGVITDRVIGAIDWASADAVKYLKSLINKE